MRKNLLVGAGYISDVHAEILRGLSSVKLWGVVDRDASAAERLARRWSIANTFPTLDEAIATGEVGAAHVLTPPDTHHDVALALLRARIPVLVEKPLAASSAECDALNAAADEAGIQLSVNQNLVFDPAFERLRRVVKGGGLGPVRSIDCTFRVSLRQLASRQFGHWMFCAPVNLLLEQAVHPLSQIVALAGKIDAISASSAPPSEISPGRLIYPSFNATLRTASVTAQLSFAVASSFPTWQLRVDCDDGVAVADITNNRLQIHRRSRLMDPLDQFVSGLRTSRDLPRDTSRNLVDFLASTARVRSRSDPFFVGMKASIHAFHSALDRGIAPETDGRFGAHLVWLCEQIGRAVPFATNGDRTKPSAEGGFDTLVIGGTGFIGTHLVRRLLDRGHKVGVFARNIRNLPDVFCDARVTLIAGDIRNQKDVAAAVRSARQVINLAHGGGAGSYELLHKAMVGGAENVARACLDHNIQRLIHVGSIASLYLGGKNTATGTTPVEARPALRADYARAKAACDTLLFELAETRGLPVCILRPGVVVGHGGIPAHTGVGFYNNDQHCIGWGSGRNPLPFVLADDVADAIVAACFASTPLERAYNLVGDVRLSARAYIEELGKALERPLRFHPQSTLKLWLVETGKWMIKRAIGRKAPRPTLHDFRSRTLVADFDCSDAKRDLGWIPEADHERFIERGIRVYAAGMKT